MYEIQLIVRGFLYMTLTVLLIFLQLQDVLNINVAKELMFIFENTDSALIGLEITYGIILVYMLIVLLFSLSKINFGRLVSIKSDQSTYLISILSGSVLYSYVCFPLYYNFAESVMILENSVLTKVCLKEYRENGVY